MHKKFAFTLIELLLFLVIFAIFSSITAPRFLTYQKKIRLQASTEIMKTYLYKNFSNARSKPNIFGVSGIAASNDFQIFECNYPDCSTIINTETITLRKNVSIDQDFNIKFLPPHGDLEFNGGDEISIFLNYESEQKEIKIYKQSGLITNEE
jgi:Tfp pilus assembly major pilin PilA